MQSLSVVVVLGGRSSRAQSSQLRFRFQSPDSHGLGGPRSITLSLSAEPLLPFQRTLALSLQHVIEVFYR